MCNEDAFSQVEGILRMPLFARGFLEFFRIMQEEGIMAAKNYWSVTHGMDFLIPKAPEIFEKLIDFYIILGFVPRKRHEKVLEENGNLKEENTVLKNTVRELKANVLTSHVEDTQKTWQEISGQQMVLSSETVKNLVAL